MVHNPHSPNKKSNRLVAFFVRRKLDENPRVRPDDRWEESTRSVIPHSPQSQSCKSSA